MIKWIFEMMSIHCDRKSLSIVLLLHRGHNNNVTGLIGVGRLYNHRVMSKLTILVHCHLLLIMLNDRNHVHKPCSYYADHVKQNTLIFYPSNDSKKY